MTVHSSSFQHKTVGMVRSNLLFYCVADPDSLGSELFCWIRIRNKNLDADLTINFYGKFCRSKIQL